MIFVLIAFILASFIGIKLRRNDNSNKDYLDKKTTASICGFFVFMVFMNHITRTMDASYILDKPAAFFCQNILGQLIVVPFLFYSGYGLTYQYLTRKDEYLKYFLIKRVFKVYLFYVICLLLRQLSNFFVHGCKDFIFNPIELVFPSYWYMFVILVEYLLMFFIFLIFKTNKKAIVISNVLTSLILALSLCLAGKETHWFNTIIAFPFGVFWASYRDNLDQVLANKRKYRNLCIITIAAICVFGICGFVCFMRLEKLPYLVYPYLLFYYISVIAFMLSILLFTYMFHYGNKFLSTVSLYTFHVYSLQRLTFELFTDGVDLLSKNRYLYFFSCLALTIALSIVMKFLYDLFWKYTFNRIKFKN